MMVASERTIYLDLAGPASELIEAIYYQAVSFIDTFFGNSEGVV